VLDHLGDLEADFLRFYGIHDMLALDGPRFFRLAYRVFAYQGVMTARYENERGDEPMETRTRGGDTEATLSARQFAALHADLVEYHTVDAAPRPAQQTARSR
jgi:hypothetical protein